MAAVPERVLNWLYSVLTNEYHDVNRTYSDVAEALSHFPSLSPRTEVYTYENGTSALLVLLSGTIPVTFRGVVYRFPIALWVPHAYPRESPLVYVTPSQDMVIRAGQHVSGDGRVYHPYLAQWDRYWDKSSVLDFLAVLRGVFAKEPPVISKQQAQYGSARTEETRPPPVPPPPEEWRRPIQQSPVPSSHPEANLPPPPPPKPGQQPSGRPTPQPSQQDGGPEPPPLPPPPPGLRGGTINQPGGREQSTEPQRAYRPTEWEKPMPPLPAEAQGSNYAQPFQPPQQYSNSPVSPITPEGQPLRAAPYQQPQPPQYASPPPPPLPSSQRDPNNYGPPPPHQPFPGRQVSGQYPPQPGYVPPPVPHPLPQQNNTLAKAKQPIPDILDSPLEVTIPSQTGSLPDIPAPPIPPNPEKDALLRALSSTLIAQLNQSVASNQSALGPLQAQQIALRQAHTRLQAEIDQLVQLDAALASNEAILVNSMREADHVIEESKTRKIPDVDEVLVAPTVVGNQLYVLCAEERAVGDAMFVLGRALDGGRVGFDPFIKQTRSLAREQFLKKALIKKIARGMGLDEYDYNR